MDNLENVDVPVAAHDTEALPIDPATVQDERKRVALEVKAKINQ